MFADSLCDSSPANRSHPGWSTLPSFAVEAVVLGSPLLLPFFDTAGRVQPQYPALAKMARVQGAVVLHAVISKQGTIEGLEMASGPAALIQAAVEAVRQWRCRPYYLNDEPVEVDTQVTVNLVLAGG